MQIKFRKKQFLFVENVIPRKGVLFIIENLLDC